MQLPKVYWIWNVSLHLQIQIHISIKHIDWTPPGVAVIYQLLKSYMKKEFSEWNSFKSKKTRNLTVGILFSLKFLNTVDLLLTLLATQMGEGEWAINYSWKNLRSLEVGLLVKILWAPLSLLWSQIVIKTSNVWNQELTKFFTKLYSS
jgi:hypothetical protein